MYPVTIRKLTPIVACLGGLMQPNAAGTTPEVQLSDPSIRFNARLGAVLFIVYLVIYLTFIVLAAFARERMQAQVLAGLNLAVAYGFALIFIAFLLALIYMLLCKSAAPASAPAASTQERP